MLWVGVIRSLDKRKYCRGKGMKQEYRRLYAVAKDYETARARLTSRVPGGWELRVVEPTSPGAVPVQELRAGLTPRELQELERGMALSGRTLASTARP